MTTINESNEELYARASALGAATVYEAAGQVGALPSRIKPVVPGMKVAGPAFPVSGPPGDNLFIHHAVTAAKAGDVLVINVGNDTDHGYGHHLRGGAGPAARLPVHARPGPGSGPHDQCGGGLARTATAPGTRASLARA